MMDDRGQGNCFKWRAYSRYCVHSLSGDDQSLLIDRHLMSPFHLEPAPWLTLTLGVTGIYIHDRWYCQLPLFTWIEMRFTEATVCMICLQNVTEAEYNMHNYVCV